VYAEKNGLKCNPCLFAVGTMHFDDPNLGRSYSPSKAYAQSKLANVLFSNELARRLQGEAGGFPCQVVSATLAVFILNASGCLCVSGTGVTTYSLHPGIVQTELFRHLNSSYFCGIQAILSGVGAVFFKTAEEGAQTTIRCAVDEKLADKTGLYYR
jgi:NAD(P)-dependent dehydrogenase (short-subunit alcohol dehydrogenase family)